MILFDLLRTRLRGRTTPSLSFKELENEVQALTRSLQQWMENLDKTGTNEKKIAWLRAAASVHQASVLMQTFARRLKLRGVPGQKNTNELQGGEALIKLHRDLAAVLKRQSQEYRGFIYTSGQYYQGYDLIGLFGIRDTERRFENYEIARWISSTDRVLDVGANTGFVGIHTAYRTGARIDCIEHNPYMVEAGRIVADYLHLSERVTFHATRMQNFPASGAYTRCFNFAAHWTDDEGLRLPFEAHMDLLMRHLQLKGIVLFESHSNEVATPTFDAKLASISRSFDVLERRIIDAGEREFVVLQRRSDTYPF